MFVGDSTTFLLRPDLKIAVDYAKVLEDSVKRCTCLLSRVACCVVYKYNNAFAQQIINSKSLPNPSTEVSLMG